MRVLHTFIVLAYFQLLSFQSSSIQREQYANNENSTWGNATICLKNAINFFFKTQFLFSLGNLYPFLQPLVLVFIRGANQYVYIGSVTSQYLSVISGGPHQFLDTLLLHTEGRKEPIVWIVSNFHQKELYWLSSENELVHHFFVQKNFNIVYRKLWNRSRGF